MRLLVNRHGEGPSCYFVAGPVLHKALEVGFQRWKSYAAGGFDYYWRFRTRGDHAGLTFYVEVFGWLFELNIHDDRHWNWKENRFKLPEEHTFEGYPY